MATDTYAYVTLRSGTACGGGNDQLDIIDISDIENPVLVKSYGMQGPYGLGVDGSVLFVYDGKAGLKVYDVTDPSKILLLEAIQDRETYDVILTPPRAIVVGPAGLDQYDYSNTADIQRVSTISIASE